MFPLVAGAAFGLGKKLLGRGAGKLAGKAGGLIGRAAGKIGGIVRRPGVAGAAGAIGGQAVYERVSRGGGGDFNAIGGLPIITDAEEVEVMRAPPGYVLITDPESGDKVAMLREVAYALKLRKRPSRGGISAREVRAARRVQSFVTSLTVKRAPKVPLKKGRR